jgi:hsp70-interacting protein
MIPDPDITVRRKTAFLLNALLIPCAAAAAAPAASSSGTVIREDGPSDSAPEAGAGASVHPNSHASMVVDPASADTAPATLRALHTHGLLPTLVRELTVPTPYGADGDEGEICDADLAEKLMRCVRRNTTQRGRAPPAY